MKKSIFVVLSLLVIAMFLVGCAPQEELSQEDQQALDSELNQMSDEQLDQVIEEAESEGATALAGQAYSKYKAIPKASKSRVLSSAYKTKLARASCDTTGTLLEGETNNYVADGINYEITVTNFLYQAYAGGVHSVEFSVNGETFTLLEGESYTLADGGTIKLTNMLYQAYAGGVHSATFCLNGGTQSCDATGTLLEGETNNYNADGITYEINVNNFLYQAYAGGVHSVEFTVNGETFTLLEGESYTLADGGTIKLTNMLYQAYAGGVHSASFCLNAGAPACDESFTLLEGETRDLASAGSLTLTSVLYQAYAGGVHSATLCFND
ncbi:MAG: hypothetical protein KJ597_00765 [Nanoarchaeota archaeon]|nr:hypothetical protein [Nanoarchaeota archaeon]MBU1622083.1 hypothetical protein [Nanoarchaeota archaeon]